MASQQFVLPELLVPPAVSPAGTVSMYADATTHCFKTSGNGSAYKSLLSSSHNTIDVTIGGDYPTLAAGLAAVPVSPDPRAPTPTNP